MKHVAKLGMALLLAATLRVGMVPAAALAEEEHAYTPAVATQSQTGGG